jgi:hypothetical protein
MSLDPGALQRKADVIVAAVDSQYGAQLQPGDLEFLRGRLDRAIDLLSALDQVQLANSDEPDVVFQVEENARVTGRHSR